MTEQKTGKRNTIALNKEAIQSLRQLQDTLPTPDPGEYIFKSRVGVNQPIVRSYAFRIIKQAVSDLNLEGTISCHSLRKTFGYHAWTGIDCWSWNNAYKNRYGFIGLDLKTQKRTIKKSGFWYKELSENHGFVIEEE